MPHKKPSQKTDLSPRKAAKMLREKKKRSKKQRGFLGAVADKKKRR